MHMSWQIHIYIYAAVCANKSWIDLYNLCSPLNARPQL